MSFISIDPSFRAFWPEPCSAIQMSVVDIRPEQVFPDKPIVVAAGKRLRLLANCLHTIDALNLSGPTRAILLRETASTIRDVATSYSGEDQEQLQRIATFVDGTFNDRELLASWAGYVEDDIVLLFAPLATWRGKTKERRVSFILGRADRPLRRLVADVTDTRLLAWAREAIDDRLVLASPLPAVNFVDLVFCGGESDLFPKHYAYFLPENAGYPHCPSRKTVVFSNVHEHKYRTFSSELSERFASAFCRQGRSEQAKTALGIWIRAHDLGHSLQHASTTWPRLSQRDYFWSMACQELWADLVGYAFALEPSVVQAAGLSMRDMGEVLLAEMFRYASGGPRSAPDALAAHWQLASLFNAGVLHFADGVLSVAWDRLRSSVNALLQSLGPALLASDVDAIERLQDGLAPGAQLSDLIATMAGMGSSEIYRTSL